MSGGGAVGKGNRPNKGPSWECEATSIEQGTQQDWNNIIKREITK